MSSLAEAKDIFLEHMKDQKGSRCDSSCSSSVALRIFFMGSLSFIKGVASGFGYSK